MNVLFLAAGVHAASCRFRLTQYIPYLEARGVSIHIADLAAPPASRRRLLASAAGYDVVVVHRALLRIWDLLVLRRAAYVFDFDDAIMFRDSSQRKGFRSWEREIRFRRVVKGARSVIAGNSYLAAMAARFNSRVAVIPTCIELAPYPASSLPPNPEPPILGWIGTRVNLMYLAGIGGALSRIGCSGASPALKIVCDGFMEFPNIRTIRKTWVLEEEAADVASFHIGLMPLPDDPWTRGKCACKILQYMAAGRPVVCSPVGANCDIVEDGKNGFFARTEEEWVARLEELLADPALRCRLGQAGRDLVERKYSTANNAVRFLEAIGGAAPAG